MSGITTFRDGDFVSIQRFRQPDGSFKLYYEDGNGKLLPLETGISVLPNFGNVLYVSVNGNDATAEKGNYLKPWLKLTQAAQASVSGDLIIVLSGSYEITDSDIADIGVATDATLFRDGVTWYFQPNTTVTSSVSEGTPYQPFYVGADNISCKVLGYLNYVGQQGTSAITYNASHAFLYNESFNNVELYIEANNIDSGKHGGSFRWRGTDNKLTLIVKDTWTHRIGTGFYGGTTTTARNTVLLRFNKIFSNELPDIEQGGGGYATPLLYPTGTDCNYIFEVKEAYVTESDGVVGSQAKEGQFISVNNLTTSRLTVKVDTYYNDFTYAKNDAIIFLRTVDCDIDIEVNHCYAENVVYGVISLYNQNSLAEADPSRINIRGSYIGVNDPCITDLGHYGSAAIRNDDQVRIKAHLRSENSEVVRMDRAAADFELSGEVRCDWDDIAGHGIVLDAVGANIRLRDLEIVCTNAGADAINSSVGAINLLGSNVFSHTNSLGTGVTISAPSGFTTN